MTTSSSVVPASTTSRTSASNCPATASSCSPACPGRGSPAWPSTRSSPRASAATSSRCRPTPGSSSGRWTSPTSTSSRACRRRSRSTRSRPTATRAPPSAPSPRSTTTSACSSPGPAARTARCAASRSPGRARSRSSTGCSSCPSAPASRCSRRSCAPARASTSTCSPSCSPRASPGPGSTARSVALTEPPKLEKQVKHTIDVVVDRLVAKGPTTRRRSGGSPTRSRPRSAWPAGVLVVEFVDLDEGDPEPRAPVLREDGLPQRPPAADGRGRAALVLVQQPVRRLPRVHRHRHRARGRPRPHRPRRGPQPRRGRHRAVGQRLRGGRLLPAGHGRPGRRPQVLDGHAVAGPAAAGPGGPAARQEPQGARALPQPVRPRAVLLHRLRGRRRVRQAAARRDRLRLEP